ECIREKGDYPIGGRDEVEHSFNTSRNESVPAVVPADNASSEHNLIEVDGGGLLQCFSQEICAVAVANVMEALCARIAGSSFGVSIHEPLNFLLSSAWAQKWEHGKIAVGRCFCGDCATEFLAFQLDVIGNFAGPVAFVTDAVNDKDDIAYVVTNSHA